MVTWSLSLDEFYHSFSSLEGGGSLASSSSSSTSAAAPRAIFPESCVSENSFTPSRYSASAFRFPPPDISPAAPAMRPDAAGFDFMLRVDDEAPFDREAVPLDALRAGDDLRAAGRDFEEDPFEEDAFEEERDFVPDFE